MKELFKCEQRHDNLCTQRPVKMEPSALLFVSLAFCIVLLESVGARDLNFCQPDLKGWLFEIKLKDRCYEFVTKKEERRSWSEARDYCQVNGGRLINIEDSDKQAAIELNMNTDENEYMPANNVTYDPLELKNSTWEGYDPDVWIGAMRDSDGVTWRFDQYQTSRTVRSALVLWFNYGSDPTLLKEQDNPKNRFTVDTCLFMRFNYTRRMEGNITYLDIVYPWYQHQQCSNTKNGHKHPFICEYEGYAYRDSSSPRWMVIIIVLGAFVSCGFISCTIYCLWDKIHTSYNVLQV